MKKVILSLAGVFAATAFAPEASAIPSFSRQTSMACTTCHAQHFPVLNSFGQAFKAGGYTMMGAQGKVEGERLSLPDTLNMSLVLKARYQKENGTDGPGIISGETKNGGQLQLADEFAFLVGGRVAENVGFLFEGALHGGPEGGIAAGFKMPFVFDVRAVKLSAIPFYTDGLGVAYGYELASTGAMRAARWSEHRKEISAQQYIGTDGKATGLALVAQNDMGYINLSRWSPTFVEAIQLKSNYLRIAATPTAGDWAMHIGGQLWNGSGYTNATPAVISGVATPALIPGVPAALVDTKAAALDFQAQGQLAGKDLSVYATWAKAPAAAGATPNHFNGGANDKKAWTIGADYSVIPKALHIGAAYRNARNGKAAGVDGDNAITLNAVYDLRQNVALHLAHSSYSGSAYNTAGKADALTTLMLFAAW